MERRLRELEEGPALVRYRTTTRPLDGLASREGMGRGDEFEEYRGGVSGNLVRCPPVRRRGWKKRIFAKKPKNQSDNQS